MDAALGGGDLTECGLSQALDVAKGRGEARSCRTSCGVLFLEVQLERPAVPAVPLFERGFQIGSPTTRAKP